MEGLDLVPQGRNLRTELCNNARGLRGDGGDWPSGSSGCRRGGGFTRLGASTLGTQVHQHVTLVDFDIAGQDPASLWVEHLGGQLSLEGMENGDDPLDRFGAVLWTRGRDSRNCEGFAGVGASLRGPGPEEGVSVKVVEDRAGDCGRSETSLEGAFGEGMPALSYL